MKLTKIDSARCQLETAIRLFFNNEDAVSIFSLASNSWEIIDSLCNHKGIASLSNETREHSTDGLDLKKDLINEPFRNFFKHADRDPQSVIDGFDHQECDPIIFLAVVDYLRLCKKSPIEFQVYQSWYLAVNIEKVADDWIARMIETINDFFPKIRELSRERQVLMGKKVLESAPAYLELHKGLGRSQQSDGVFAPTGKIPRQPR